MTQTQTASKATVRQLISDLLPLDHVSLNTKRIRFIKGQGVLLYDDNYVVEIYAPYSRTEDYEFFAVQRHHGNIDKMSMYYQRLPILQYNDVRVSDGMREKFGEAIFQYMPVQEKPRETVMHPAASMQRRWIYTSKVSGAA